MSSYSPYRFGDYGNASNKMSSSYLSPSRSKSPYRNKSPYRSTSSLSRDSHDANLKVDTDYFNMLNKSLGAHDSSFLSAKDDDNDETKSSSSGPNYSKYSSFKNSKSNIPSKTKFNIGKLNKDYSTTNYKLGGGGGADSSDYDYNNNLSISGLGKKYYSTGRLCTSGLGVSGHNSGSESDYELSYAPRSGGISGTSGVFGNTTNTFSKSKGENLIERKEDEEKEEEEMDNDSSDESVSEWANCKSFCPDSRASSSQFFVSLQF